MVNILRKLISCIHRHHVSKEVKPVILFQCQNLLKLSRFELIPDEILLEIFEYLSLIDLYNCFVNLNFRFNLLLRDVRLRIYLNQTDELKKDFSNIISYFSKSILSLHIDYYSLLNLKSFSNLRSLIIYFPTRNQLLTINNQIMPYLNRLWIGIINQNDQQILQENLFQKNSLSKLKFCYLFQIDFNENSLHSYQICSNIRILSISNIKSKDFVFILSLFPNLSQLNIGISDVFSQISDDLIHFSHQNLRILKMEFFDDFCQLNHLNYLSSFVPYIEQCTLLLLNIIQTKDYQILEKILTEKFVQLKQFHFSIDYSCQLSSNQMINKFQKFKIKYPFFQTMKILPCDIHQDKCLRKTSMNKTLFHQH